jgi:tetratricopeptide (TPR) repeat protein
VALAEREIAAANAIDPNNAELKLLIGDSNRLASNVPAAEAAYNAANSAMTGRADAQLGLAQLYENAQRFDDAQAAYRRATEIDANDPVAALMLGRFLLKRRNDATNALPLLRRAVENRPSWPEALVALGDAQLASNSVSDALAAFQQATQLAPTQPGAQSGLGRARIRNNQIAEAEAPLRTAIEQVPNDAEAHMALADVLARTDRRDAAIEEWNRAIDLLPSDPSPRMRAAELARSMGQNSLARAYIDRILSDDQQYSPALLLRADIAFEENDRTNARQLYQAALTGHGEIDRARAQARIREIDAPNRNTRRR